MSDHLPQATLVFQDSLCGPWMKMGHRSSVRVSRQSSHWVLGGSKWTAYERFNSQSGMGEAFHQKIINQFLFKMFSPQSKRCLGLVSLRKHLPTHSSRELCRLGAGAGHTWRLHYISKWYCPKCFFFGLGIINFTTLYLRSYQGGHLVGLGCRRSRLSFDQVDPAKIIRPWPNSPRFKDDDARRG